MEGIANIGNVASRLKIDRIYFTFPHILAQIFLDQLEVSGYLLASIFQSAKQSLKKLGTKRALGILLQCDKLQSKVRYVVRGGVSTCNDYHNAYPHIFCFVRKGYWEKRVDKYDDVVIKKKTYVVYTISIPIPITNFGLKN